jgi:hypothetical protein
LAGTGIQRNPEESGGIRRNPEESGGIRRNPEESGGIQSKFRNSYPAVIPAKNSCDSSQNRNSCNPLQNHVPVKKILQKTQEKKEILRNPVLFCFSAPKIDSCQTGICNLDSFVDLIHF